MSLAPYAPPTLKHPPGYPPCPQCSAKMTLTGIEPINREVDKRSFKCTACAYTEAVLFSAR